MTQHASAESIVKPLTVPDVRERLIHALPARTQTREGPAEINRAMGQLTSLLKRTPRLRECDTVSIYSCIIAAIGLKLEVNTPLGHCYLIPFKGECKLVMGYAGLVDLARRGSKIKAITAEAVYEGDEFYAGLGTENKIVHRRVYSDEPLPLTHTYAIAFYDPQNYQFVVLQKHEIDKVRAVSKNAKRPDSPWNQWFERQAIKTAVKRLCKLLPQQTDELAIAIEHDDRYETGAAQDIPRIPLPDGTDLLPDGTERSKAPLAQKMQAGAKKQETSELDRLRGDIWTLAEKIPADKRDARVRAVCESVGVKD